MLQIGYVGSQGRKLTVTENINQNGAFNSQYPNVGSINQFNSAVPSNYNSFQASCGYGPGAALPPSSPTPGPTRWTRQLSSAE